MKKLLSLLLLPTLLVGCLSYNGEESTDPINKLPSMLGCNIDDVTNEFISAGYAIHSVVIGGESEQRSCFSRMSGEIVLPVENSAGAVDKIATLFVINTQDASHLTNVITTYDGLLISSYSAQFTSAYITLSDDSSSLSYNSIDALITALELVDFDAVKSAGVVYSATVDGASLTLEVPYFQASLYGTTGSPTANFYSGIWFKL